METEHVSYIGVGLMSGTSCDGIDLCRVKFTTDPSTDTWTHQVLEAVTIPYDASWKHRLTHLQDLSAYDVIKLHVEYGHLLGQALKEFIGDKHVDFVSSHGHTVFHRPEEGVTFQMGDGETMPTYLQQPLVTSLRNKDVALGGQGAPIVPFGEKFLYNNFDVCVNFGGICNVSVDSLGFDVAPCNMVLNEVANSHDNRCAFDQDGVLARSGVVLPSLLQELNSLEFYSQPPPKSLAREWYEREIQPILQKVFITPAITYWNSNI